jgi:amidase
LQVAVGEVDMAIGTDQGGSVRLPSSWCGIVGLKPTFGLVPCTGILSLAFSVDHCGPMARTVHDCALLLEVSWRHCGTKNKWQIIGLLLNS